MGNIMKTKKRTCTYCNEKYEETTNCITRICNECLYKLKESNKINYILQHK